MEIINQASLSLKQKSQLLHLWNNEYPEQLAYKNREGLEQYLENLTAQNHFLLVDEEETVLGWSFTFNREKETWFAIIISERLQGKGFGTKMLNMLKENEHKLNAWVTDHNRDKKLNGDSYKSPLEFYKKCGFNIIPEERLELDIISAIKIKWER